MLLLSTVIFLAGKKMGFDYVGVYDVQFQLIRIELRVPEYGWTTQKVFHLMNFVVNGGDFPVLPIFGVSLS